MYDGIVGFVGAGLLEGQRPQMVMQGTEQALRCAESAHAACQETAASDGLPDVNPACTSRSHHIAQAGSSTACMHCNCIIVAIRNHAGSSPVLGGPLQHVSIMQGLLWLHPVTISDLHVGLQCAIAVAVLRARGYVDVYNKILQVLKPL
jgi:hypothetical protein